VQSDPPTHTKRKKNWIINNKLKTSTQQRRREAEIAPEKGEVQGADLHTNFSKQRLERQEG
jgi:hypothetical protein